MLRETRTWDLRLPKALIKLFPVRRGYWFKVDRNTAQFICFVLARAYKVSVPTVTDATPKDANGWYHPKTRAMSVHARGHIKTVFHEFYHHLDEVTGGEYDSSDNPKQRLTPRGERTGPISLAWQYAERMFELLRVKYRPPEDRVKRRVETDETQANWNWARTRVAMRDAEEREDWAMVGSLSALEKIQKLQAEAYKNLKRSHKGFERLKVSERTRLVTRYVKEQLKEEERMAKEKMKLAVAKLNKEAQQAAKAATVETKAPKTKEAKPKVAKGAGGRSGVSDDMKITVLFKGEPEGKPGTKGRIARDLYKTGMTVGEWRAAVAAKKGDAGYLLVDIKKERIKVA